MQLPVAQRSAAEPFERNAEPFALPLRGRSAAGQVALDIHASVDTMQPLVVVGWRRRATPWHQQAQYRRLPPESSAPTPAT